MIYINNLVVLLHGTLKKISVKSTYFFLYFIDEICFNFEYKFKKYLSVI